jgi:hypothetical protein
MRSGLVLQVGAVEEAKSAATAGVDAIITRGIEAGGAVGGSRSMTAGAEQSRALPAGPQASPRTRACKTSTLPAKLPTTMLSRPMAPGWNIEVRHHSASSPGLGRSHRARLCTSCLFIDVIWGVRECECPVCAGAAIERQCALELFGEEADELQS